MEGYEKYEGYDTRDKLSGEFYENYDSHDSLNPYQMLNQMKSWNKSIYLYVDDIDARTQATLAVHADEIEIRVKEEDYNGNEIASRINMTSTTINIEASRINITGSVTLAQIGTSGTSIIHGDRITTGTLNANRIVANSITANQIATDAIQARHIQTNAVTADAVAADAIYAGSIQSDAIRTRHIQTNAVTANAIAADAVYAGAIQAGVIGASHIAADAIEARHISAYAISADMIQTGYMTANRIDGGTLSGVTIDVDTDAVIGRYLRLGATVTGTEIDGRNGYFDVWAEWRTMFTTDLFSINANRAVLNGSDLVTWDDLDNLGLT